MTPFGKLVRAHRSRRGLLLADQAEALNVSLAAVSAYETGRRVPNERYAKEVADYLVLTPTERTELLASLVLTNNIIAFQPKDSAVASLAYSISKRLNELSPKEICELRKIVDVEEDDHV